jgi:serine O-acetyltransferase
MNDIEINGQTIAETERSDAPSEAQLWRVICGEAREIGEREPSLHGFLEAAVLRHDGLGEALVALLARKLADSFMSAARLEALARSALAAEPAILAAASADLVAIRARDPAAQSYSTPFLYYKGFHSLQWHRVAHWLWRHNRREIAHFLQSRVSEVFAVDIHPAVPIGLGVFIDHGTGLVVGETSVIGNDVSILQEVTLGGTGKERGDRHPKVRDGVLLAAGAKILGNIEIGRNAKVGAGSVVLESVPPCATVVGVPARVVGWCRETTPALAMDQSLPDSGI